MDSIYGYIGENNSKGKLYKLISNTTLYNIKTKEFNVVEYSQHTLKEEGQWYKISDFSKTEYCIEIFSEPFNSTKFPLADTKLVKNIKFIMAYQDNNLFCFQRVQKNNYIEKKIITIGDGCKVSKDKRIIINDFPDAIYNKNDDELYFKQITTISVIFPNIMNLYKEATNDETKNFLKSNFIVCDNNFSYEQVGKLSRKYIVAVNENKNLKTVNKDLLKYVKSYCPNLKIKNKKVHITSDSDLRNLLYGINEKYFTSEITKEKRLANSYILLKTK